MANKVSLNITKTFLSTLKSEYNVTPPSTVKYKHEADRAATISHDVGLKFIPGPAKWFSRRGGQIISFLKKFRPPWLTDEENFWVYFSLRPYIELFCVEQKVKIIINNTWNIPFFTFIEQKAFI